MLLCLAFALLDSRCKATWLNSLPYKNPSFLANRCNGGVNLMLDWDTRGAFRMAALQSAAGRKLLQRAGRSPDDISSIVLVEPGQAYIKSEAVLRIAQGLNMPLALLAGLAFLVPRPPADAIYDTVRMLGLGQGRGGGLEVVSRWLQFSCLHAMKQAETTPNGCCMDHSGCGETWRSCALQCRWPTTATTGGGTAQAVV